MNDPILKDILRRLKALEQTAVRYRSGEVTGTGPLDVALGGASTSYEDVAAIGTVVIGDQVATLLWGNDLLVLGTIGDGGTKVGFPFGASWADLAGVEAATYSKHGNVVHLQGAAQKTGTPASGDVIGTLPAGFRPTGTLVFAAGTGNSAGTRTAGELDVNATGQVIWRAGTNTLNTNFISLSGISFLV